MAEVEGPKTNHCMYMQTGEMTLDEVEKYVTKLIESAQNKIMLRVSNYVPNCRFLLNMPKTRDGKTMSHCYVWVTAREVFKELIAPRNVVEPKPETMEIPTILNIFKIDWAAEEVPHVALTTIPEFKGFLPSFGPARSERVNVDEFEEGKLFCLTKCKSLTADILAEIFSPFVTYGRMVVEKNARGSIFIAFDNPDDAYFALHMRKKYFDPVLNTLLSFDHARRIKTPYQRKRNDY